MKSRNSSQCNETFLVMAVKPGKNFGFSLLRKTCNADDDRTDSGRLFQTDAAVTGKVRSPMVEGSAWSDRR